MKLGPAPASLRLDLFYLGAPFAVGFMHMESSTWNWQGVEGGKSLQHLRISGGIQNGNCTAQRPKAEGEVG